LSNGERRLAAIMFTDIVGYTKLMQENESAAVGILKDHRELIRPLFASHGGREIKTIGDAFLIEFSSALDATLCAIAVQSALNDRKLSRGEKLEVRIGIHVGDVIESKGDIIGDAVNIASRIEPLAEPGGVCISGPVFEQVGNKLPYPLDKVAMSHLKNVREPVDVYRVVLPWVEVQPAELGAAALDTRRVAVLPFVSMSPDPNDEYFADGLTEELITRISSVRGLDVIARTSAMNYKREKKSVSQIGRELKVGTLLEGSVRKAGNRIRVSAQLINAKTEAHLWAQNYDRNLEDIFEVQSDIAQKVAEAMKITLLETEVQEIERRPTKSMEAYENYLRALQMIQTGNLSHQSEIIRRLERAIELDPGFASAYASLGNLYVEISGETMSFREAFEKATPLIARALELDDGSSDAHMANGNLALQSLLDFRSAETEFKKAISINPSNAPAHFWYGSLHRAMGDLAAAVVDMNRANELDPLSNLIKFWLIWLLFLKGDHDEAFGLAESRADAWSAGGRATLAYMYLLSGNRNRAEKEAEEGIALGSAQNIYDEARYSLVMANLGRPEEARSLLKDAESMGLKNREFLAEAYIALGDNDRAFELLEEGFADSPVGFLLYHREPGFDPVRDDPRFLSLIQRLKIPKPQA